MTSDSNAIHCRGCYGAEGGCREGVGRTQQCEQRGWMHAVLQSELVSYLAVTSDRISDTHRASAVAARVLSSQVMTVGIVMVIKRLRDTPRDSTRTIHPQRTRPTEELTGPWILVCVTDRSRSVACGL